MKNYIIINIIIVISVLFSSNSFAGNAKLNIIHNNPELKVIKFEFRYGTDKKDDPSLYTKSVFVIPETPALGQTTCEVKFEGSGLFYVSVKDYYEGGTSSDYSEPFQLNNIPKNVNKPVIKMVTN